MGYCNSFGKVQNLSIILKCSTLGSSIKFKHQFFMSNKIQKMLSFLRAIKLNSMMFFFFFFLDKVTSTSTSSAIEYRGISSIHTILSSLPT